MKPNIITNGLLLFACISNALLSSACQQDATLSPEPLESVAGLYRGTAEVVERVFIDGDLVFDTTYTFSDELQVSEIEVDSNFYHFELSSGFQPYGGGTPLDPVTWYLDEFYGVYIGFDATYGYSYDDKKHWRFDPEADTAYFRLAHFPNGPREIPHAHPDSINVYQYEIHEWDYVLRALR